MPDCYGAEVDLDTGRAIVVLEDMGYRAGDQVEGCDVEEAKQIIDAFVPLHVAFWGTPTETSWPRRCASTRSTSTGSAPLLRRRGSVASRCTGTASRRTCVTGSSEYIADVRDLHTLMGDRTQTLVHGDVRLDNVMFGEEEGQHEIALIDWQAIMVSNPGQDLAYLLSQNVRTEERRAHEDELLHHYHDRLLEQGVQDYSFEQCVDDYDVAVLYLLAYPIVVAGFDPPNERGVKLAEAFLTRVSRRSPTVSCSAACRSRPLNGVAPLLPSGLSSSTVTESAFGFRARRGIDGADLGTLAGVSTWGVT